jgi:hypothetical protein
MTLLQALAADPRFPRLSDRKAIAVELVVKRLDAVLDGDDHYPANWLRMIDHIRQEGEIAPFMILND